MLSKRQYVALSNFRCQIAQFERFSERAAHAAGLTQTQYLLLLHIRGYPGRDWATVGELAERLQASPHGTVALIRRCAALGLVSKRRATQDARYVQVRLSARGRRLVAQVASHHRAELKSQRGVFRVADLV